MRMNKIEVIKIDGYYIQSWDANRNIIVHNDLSNTVHFRTRQYITDFRIYRVLNRNLFGIFLNKLN